MALATVLYLIYLFTPIVLLFVGSFGHAWFNTLLPTGFTLEWYLQVASDGSFRRAFWTSLQVCLLTCIICAIAGTPFPYAIYGAASNRWVRGAALFFCWPNAGSPACCWGFEIISGLFLPKKCPFLGTPWVASRRPISG